MGLDIWYHRYVSEANGNEAFDETGELKHDEGWFQVYVNPDFPKQADDLKDRHAYKAQESSGFCAGSYSGYSRWREKLAELSGWDKTAYKKASNPEVKSFAASAWNSTSGNFWELICFSNCEGVIGPLTSAKLANDFAIFQDKADKLNDEGFLRTYNDFRKAFEFASENGAVLFK